MHLSPERGGDSELLYSPGACSPGRGAGGDSELYSSPVRGGDSELIYS